MQLKNILLPFCLIYTTVACAQDSTVNSPAPKVFNYVEQMPSTGYSLPTYLQTNLQYPESARRKNIEGRVIVNFVVNEDGSVSDIKIMRGIGGGCDEEAQRVVRNMPQWKPGKQNGKAVKVLFTLPIMFKLNDADELPAPEPGYNVNKYMAENMRYPKKAEKDNIRGVVKVRFVINEDGHISNEEIVNGIGGGCDKEALRLVRQMPAWNPVKKNGKPVKVQYAIPVNFRITGQ